MIEPLVREGRKLVEVVGPQRNTRVQGIKYQEVGGQTLGWGEAAILASAQHVLSPPVLQAKGGWERKRRGGLAVWSLDLTMSPG